MKNLKLNAILTAFLFISLIAGIYLAGQRQIFQNRAQSPVCPLNSAVCQWDSQGSGISYTIVITDTTTAQIWAQGGTTDNFYYFTPISGHTYRCQVTAVNSCGAGPASQAEGGCLSGVNNNVGGPNPTSTPQPTITPPGRIADESVLFPTTDFTFTPDSSSSASLSAVLATPTETPTSAPLSVSPNQADLSPTPVTSAPSPSQKSIPKQIFTGKTFVAAISRSLVPATEYFVYGSFIGVLFTMFILVIRKIKKGQNVKNKK